MPAFLCRREDPFPPMSAASPEGIVAVGGDLSPQRLLTAYGLGLFPWYDARSPILWWSPDPRCILPLDGLHVSRSLRRSLRQCAWEVTADACFDAVITACALVPRGKRAAGTKAADAAVSDASQVGAQSSDTASPTVEVADAASPGAYSCDTFFGGAGVTGIETTGVPSLGVEMSGVATPEAASSGVDFPAAPSSGAEVSDADATDAEVSGAEMLGAALLHAASPEAASSGTDGGWLLPEMRRAYIRLHELGYAHSIEVWREGRLAGGLYGVALGGAFFGESMFHLQTDASKIALVALVQYLRERGFTLLDCQQDTAHSLSMGAVVISREEFLCRLTHALRQGNGRPLF